MNPRQQRKTLASAILVATLFLSYLNLQVNLDQFTVETKQQPERPLNVPPFPGKQDTHIRKWGCARNETPFIFVHIGKAGGGNVRSRIAASALDYNRNKWHAIREDQTYYYPIWEHTANAPPKMHKGQFLNSKFPSFVPYNKTYFHRDLKFEGQSFCSATTPLGQAIACPWIPRRETTFEVNNSSRCDVIYVGHNLLGNEFHWLPTDYLVKWWKGLRWSNNDQNLTQALMGRHLRRNFPLVLGNQSAVTPKCPSGKGRTLNQTYLKCIQPRETLIDSVARNVVLGENGSSQVQWAHLYASLPLLRVTLIREPFSWLISKFFWQKQHYDAKGNDQTAYRGWRFWILKTVESTLRGKLWSWIQHVRTMPPMVKCDDIEEATTGWAARRAKLYILYLCGEHCLGGLATTASAAGTNSNFSLTLEQMEAQAAYNLRNSFAVVGVLEKTEEFYDMMARRVFYLDTTLNPHVTNKAHGTAKFGEAGRCKAVYQSPVFQQQLINRSPEIAALYRLYHIAVKVNRFQSQELQKCASTASQQ